MGMDQFELLLFRILVSVWTISDNHVVTQPSNVVFGVLLPLHHGLQSDFSGE